MIKKLKQRLCALNPGKKKRIAALGTALAAAMILAAVSAPEYISAYSAKKQLPIYSVERDQRMLSLTFDAAWGNEDTRTLIDILGKYDVKATFFVVGFWAEKFPESVRALQEAGHEIMNHSDTHPHMNSLTAEGVIAETAAANEKIAAVTGVVPTLIRCPYGEYDDHVISAIRSMGMEPIQWDVDSLDWKGYDAKTIFDRVTSRAAPGSIVLFHNAAEHTPEALEDIITHFLSQGYSIVPVSELILTGEYTIDNTGRQHSAR